MEKNIGERIRLLRQALKLTQREFASNIGIGEKTLRNYESGKFAPKEAVIKTIEQTFNVNPEWLRHGKGEMFVEKGEPERDPLEIAAERIVNIIIEKRGIKISEEKKRKIIKKLAELLKQVGEKEALDLIDIAV